MRKLPGLAPDRNVWEHLGLPVQVQPTPVIQFNIVTMSPTLIILTTSWHSKPFLNLREKQVLRERWLQNAKSRYPEPKCSWGQVQKKCSWGRSNIKACICGWGRTINHGHFQTITLTSENRESVPFALFGLGRIVALVNSNKLWPLIMVSNKVSLQN